MKNTLGINGTNYMIFYPEFSWNTGIGKQLLHLNLALRKINRETVRIDFSKLKFTPPLLSVFYGSAISESTPEISFSGLNSYLETIHFPYGLFPENDKDLVGILKNYSLRSYLPIIKFKTDPTGDNPRIRESILSHILHSIKIISNLPTNYFSALSYLISELTDNISEHSNHSYGYLAFQHYRENGFIDICLADKGIGLLGSYQNYSGTRNFSHITDHLNAIVAAIKGRSTKPIPEERGFGIATSRRILVQGLGGNFVFLSGNGLLINDELSNFGTNYQGSLVLIRIPVHNIKVGFNWSKFVE